MTNEPGQMSATAIGTAWEQTPKHTGAIWGLQRHALRRVLACTGAAGIIKAALNMSLLFGLQLACPAWLPDIGAGILAH